MAGVYALKYVPTELRERVMEIILRGNVALPTWILSMILAVVTLLLYAITKSRFQRARLIFND
jgi:hypothetical protein